MSEQPQYQPTPPVLDDEQRAQILSQAIGSEAAAGGRVESHTPHAAVVVYGQKVNHVLHVLLFFFTCGLWGIVWLIVVLTGGEKRYAVTVDPYGHLLRRKV